MAESWQKILESLNDILETIVSLVMYVVKTPFALIPLTLLVVGLVLYAKFRYSPKPAKPVTPPEASNPKPEKPNIPPTVAPGTDTLPGSSAAGNPGSVTNSVTINGNQNRVGKIIQGGKIDEKRD